MIKREKPYIYIGSLLARQGYVKFLLRVGEQQSGETDLSWIHQDIGPKLL